VTNLHVPLLDFIQKYESVLDDVLKAVTTKIALQFLSPTNAPLYYTYKMLKYTARLTHDCSYMFRPTWTIIREPMPNLAKVTVL